MKIHVTQYCLPDGRQRDEYIENMPDDLAPIVEAIRENGCNLSAEILTTGHVSFGIEHRNAEIDFDLEICPNGPEVRGALEKLIRRFDATKLHEMLQAAAD